MVRTSDFHFENVGSNPANPKLILKNQSLYHIIKTPFDLSISFHFLFASLIAPFISPNINILFQTNTWIRKKNLLKNSYIILAWFYYLDSIHTPNKDSGLRFFVLPTKAQVYTLTKAPIAHKLWSKEQYKFVFYLFRISFNNSSFIDAKITSVNQGLLFLLIVKKTIPFFSSNLMVLKTARVCFQLTDNTYFKYI